MTAALAVLAFAALFALFGLLRPKPGCGSDCGACPGGCRVLEVHDEDD